MVYTEKRIAEIEQNILRHMQQEDEELTEIEMLAESLTKRLVTGKHTRETFMGKEYIFNLDKDRAQKKIVLMITDPIRFQIAGGKYRPFMAVGDWDFNFTYEENVFMTIKGALTHKAGKIKVEELD